MKQLFLFGVSLFFYTIPYNQSISTEFVMNSKALPVSDQCPENVVDTIQQPTFKIGDSIHGGIVFWTDESGAHGLVAAPTDQSESIAWWNGEIRSANATGDGIGMGANNTILIMALETSGNTARDFAAKLCADLSITDPEGKVYNDWYLPSKYELYLMYKNLHLEGVGGFSPGIYWSSSEDFTNYAWSQNFSDGNQQFLFKNNKNRVRAIREF